MSLRWSRYKPHLNVNDLKFLNFSLYELFTLSSVLFYISLTKTMKCHTWLIIVLWFISCSIHHLTWKLFPFLSTWHITFRDFIIQIKISISRCFHLELYFCYLPLNISWIFWCKLHGWYLKNIKVINSEQSRRRGMRPIQMSSI